MRPTSFAGEGFAFGRKKTHLTKIPGKKKEIFRIILVFVNISKTIRCLKTALFTSVFTPPGLQARLQPERREARKTGFKVLLVYSVMVARGVT